jgi:hypothetical protein
MDASVRLLAPRSPHIQWIILSWLDTTVGTKALEKKKIPCPSLESIHDFSQKFLHLFPTSCFYHFKNFQCSEYDEIMELLSSIFSPAKWHY